jgi:hypothetical protein
MWAGWVEGLFNKTWGKLAVSWRETVTAWENQLELLLFEPSFT